MNNQPTTNLTRFALKITLAIACCAISAVAQTQGADAKSSPQIYQTFYLTNLTQPNDANELITDLRNMLPSAKARVHPRMGR